MSDLNRAIRRARRQIERDEAPIRRRLRQAYRDALDALNADLEAVTAMIGEARRAGVDVSPDWLRRQSRYRMLLADVEYQYRRFAEQGARILLDGQFAAVSGGAHVAPDLMTAAGVTGFGARVNVPAVERLISVMQLGSPVRQVLDSYGPYAAKVIEDEMIAGLIEGTGPREIVRRIRRGVNSGTSRARLDALTRTEMMRAFRGSLFDQYAAMGLERWRWTAALSSRTCLACLSMSGTVYPMSRPFMQAHINCRCIPSPVAPGVELETGEAWFARQPAETRRLMMPSGEAYDAYQRGDVTLDDFRGVKRSRVWGSSYVQRSGREAIGRRRRAA
jgi:SPP1 gp7 family putative phage head morphogenesis protein